MWKKWQVRKVQTWNPLLFTIQAHEKLIIYHVLYICVQIWKLRKRVSFFVNWWVKKNKTSELFQFHGRLGCLASHLFLRSITIAWGTLGIWFPSCPLPLLPLRTTTNTLLLYHLLPRSKKSKIQSFLNIHSVSSLSLFSTISNI